MASPDEIERTFSSRDAATGTDVQMVLTESGVATGLSFVLVHGIGMGHRVYRNIAEMLGTAGKVYAVDLPGFGDSPEPSVAQSMQRTGDLIAEFIRVEAIPGAVLVGHSMGTQVVVEAVAQHPEISPAKPRRCSAWAPCNTPRRDHAGSCESYV